MREEPGGDSRVPAADGRPTLGVRQGLGILLSLAAVAWLVVTVDWGDVWASLLRARVTFIALALSLNLASVGLRAVRWRLLLRRRCGSRWRRLAAGLLVGQAVNVMVPARLGDVARATLVCPKDAAFGLGTIVVEGFVDLLLVAALVLFLFWQVAVPASWQRAGQGLLGTTGIAVVAMVLLVSARSWVAKLLEKARARWRHPLVRRVLTATEELLNSLSIVQRPGQMAWVALSSLAVWACYASVNYTLFRAVAVDVPAVAAVFVLVVLQLGVAVPSSPGRIGVFHYLCMQVLILFDAVEAKAATYAVLLHLIAVVLPMVLGAILASRFGLTLGRTISGREPG